METVLFYETLTFINQPTRRINLKERNQNRSMHRRRTATQPSRVLRAADLPPERIVLREFLHCPRSLNYTSEAPSLVGEHGNRDTFVV